MFGSYFSPGHQGALASAVLLALGATVQHVRRKDRSALALLLCGALVMRLFAATLDPYLNMWDESVHALVAKNMIANPFKPMLFREEALGLSFENWTENHVWLHKQPLFLWVMALSIKLLGPTVLAVRLPSVLFSTAWVFFTYGAVKALHGRDTAFITALLLTFTHWALSQVAGSDPTDHNDVAFNALIGGSLWVWLVVMPKNERRGVVLAGLLAGLAVLTKWLPGLLVYAGWGASIIFSGPDRLHRSLRLVRSLMITTVVAAPWQIWAWLAFPAEMSNEMKLNAQHFTEAVERHSGTSGYYFEILPDKLFPLESYLTPVFALLGLLAIHDRTRRLFMLAIVIGPFVFYTLAVTKMAGYILPVVPFLLMGIAFAIDRCVAALKGNWCGVMRFATTGLLAATLLNVPRLQLWHTDQGLSDDYFAKYLPARRHNLGALAELDRLIGDAPRTVVFHVPYPENVNLAYYFGHEALEGIPGADRCERLHAAGCTIAVVDPDPDAVFPPYVRIIRGDPQFFLRW